MRRALIQFFLPLVFATLPVLGALLVASSLPSAARGFYVSHLTPLDICILSLGCGLFLIQTYLAFRAMGWRGEGFDERPDPWLNKLAQSAEWFPLLGLIGTVGGILQTFSAITGPTPQHEIIQKYAPAITATGSGLFMALVNILPSWVVLVGRGLILTLGGDSKPAGGAAMIEMPTRSITRFFIPMIDVLTLLFCIYLLMPMVSDAEGESDATRMQRERDLLEREKALARGGNDGPATEDLLAEIAKLRREKAQSLKNRLSVRVLQIDPKDGALSYLGPKGIQIAISSAADAATLVRQDQERVGGEKRELYYLILYPRDPRSAYPTLGQKADYDRWFADVALGYDVPGVEGSKSP